MVAATEIRTADLRRLRDVTDPAHVADDGGTLPGSVLEALRALIPCDQVTYEVMEPHQHLWIENRDLIESDYEVVLDDDFFWEAFWSSPVCSYPQRTGDRQTVTRSSDFQSDLDFKGSMIGEVFRIQDSQYNAVVPLAANGSVDHRIELWRSGRQDFTDRDVMLLELLRPRLVEFELAARKRREPAVLTSRQLELLGCVADGMTNRQVGRRLDISEGTVRRHLENIFERLEVRSRAAATAHFVRLTQPSSRADELCQSAPEGVGIARPSR
jgi:DNA-binding CsgD family transcriptional regulator